MLYLSNLKQNAATQVCNHLLTYSTKSVVYIRWHVWLCHTKVNNWISPMMIRATQNSSLPRQSECDYMSRSCEHVISNIMSFHWITMPHKTSFPAIKPDIIWIWGIFWSIVEFCCDILSKRSTSWSLLPSHSNPGFCRIAVVFGNRMIVVSPPIPGGDWVPYLYVVAFHPF